MNRNNRRKTVSLAHVVSSVSLVTIIGCANSENRSDLPVAASASARQEQRMYNSLPPALADFLHDKAVTVKINPDISLRLGNSISMIVTGLFFQRDNRIELLSPERTVMYHEAGHALWEDYGEDGIFAPRFASRYVGPSRDEFISVIDERNPLEAQLELLRLFERNRAYGFLLDTCGSEAERIPIRQLYGNSFGLPMTADPIIRRAYETGLPRTDLQARARDEIFASEFAQWLSGEQSYLGVLFEQMRYNGREFKKR